MYATTTIDNVAATRRTRRHSSLNYIVTGICTLMAATALGFNGTAHAGQALWVANGANVVEFASLPGGKHDEKPRVQLNSAVFGAPQGVVFDASNNLWVIDGGNGGTIAPSLEEFTEDSAQESQEGSDADAQRPDNFGLIGFPTTSGLRRGRQYVG